MAVNIKQEEAFKEFPYNKNFLVGNFGTIKDSKTNEIIKPIFNEKGYLKVLNPRKTARNPRVYEYVHRMVALTYVPGYTSIYWICHHKDYDRRNNLPENLTWVSEDYHAKIHGQKLIAA